MKMHPAAFAAALVVPLLFGTAASTHQRRGPALLELHRPKLFAGPDGRAYNLTGFCRRPECTTDECEPVCTHQPCCCWSTFAADKHPLYPSPDRVKEKQKCLFPPKGFTYAPDPGLVFNDGFTNSMEASGEEMYKGRRLCCMRRSDGVQDDSQRDLRIAVPPEPTTTTPPPPTTTVKAEAPPPPAPAAEEEVADPTPPPLFTTKVVTTTMMNPGDEYETAQMEMAARAHLEAAKDLQSAVGALDASAAAVQAVKDKLEQDPNLVRSRKHVAQMKAAIHAWAVRRWANLKRLESGDASAFDDAPAPPPGLTAQ